MPQQHLESFGEPVIKIGSLSLWVHGYEYPEKTDGWHGNWLSVTARCAANFCSVVVNGAILDTVSFARLQRELKVLQERLEGSATLESHEPNLRVRFTAVGKTGRVVVEVDITPDHLSQAHRFFETTDHTYLPAVQAGCNSVLRRFPVKDPRSRGIEPPTSQQ